MTDLAGFRRTARTWLESHVPSTPPPLDGSGARAAVLAWQATQYEGGWAGLSWPRAFGGRGASVPEQIIWYEEYARAGAPSPLDAGFVGLNHAGPTLIACGSEAQKTRHLPPLLAGETLWCQGFSEPGAGSDLAAVRTRGRVEGEDLVITGHKIWSSYADIADQQELLVRTDPEAATREALTWIICPMDTPGITIRPIRTMAGPQKFCEVFYDEVRIPLANVVGGIGGGWGTAMSTLAFERGTATLPLVIGLLRLAETLLADCPSGRPALRAHLAQLWADCAAQRAMAYRLALGSANAVPDVGGSIVRLGFAELAQRVHAAALDLYGLGAPEAIGAHGLSHAYLDAFSETIAGGSAEIQRNIIGERVLGLPKGPR